VTAELAGLRFGLRRLAFAHGSAASLEAAGAVVAYAAGRLDELLVGPLLARLGDGRPLVLVPTGVLHALPWSALPSLRGRPVSVAPSAALWRRAAEGSGRRAPVRGGGRVVVVQGPGLPGAAGEVAALAGRYPRATCLAGPAANVAAVAAALDGADLAHVAAHGSFRVDNPLFSSLRLADGPLTVYDLEGLELAPRRLVLSACDAGLSGVRPGDELMGLAGALFALGMSTLVASVIPVPDAATTRLMLALHQGLQAGAGPAEALAHARSGQDPAVAASFVCFGAG
jgi:CHAT domain-containing protein